MRVYKDQPKCRTLHSDQAIAGFILTLSVPQLYTGDKHHGKLGGLFPCYTERCIPRAINIAEIEKYIKSFGIAAGNAVFKAGIGGASTTQAHA